MKNPAYTRTCGNTTKYYGGPQDVRMLLVIGPRLQFLREVWLCRYGQSASKPFCDGSHKKAGFKSNLDEKS